MTSSPRERCCGASSCGELVTGYLLGDDTDDFGRRVTTNHADYAGFSMLYGTAGEQREMNFHSNRGEPRNELPNGVYGLSNALLDEPWPKVSFVTEALTEALACGRTGTEDLLSILDDRRRADDDALPDTGVGLAIERMLSSPFIVSPGYGTRCSTVLTITYDGRARFHERSFDASGGRIADRAFSWRLGDT